MQSFRRNTEGFTLIELLVVITVLGVLMSIAIPRISSMNNKAKDANIAQIAGSIRTAMEVYYQDEKAYPETGDISDWNDLNSVLDVLELDEMSNYNIASLNYTRNNPDNYKIEVKSSSSTAKVYLITNNDFSEE